MTLRFMHKMKVKKLTTFWERLQGLSFKNKIIPVYFETRWGIHTFFVKEPIDVIICDDSYIVRKLVRSLKPSSVLVWNPGYKKVFEIPESYGKNAKINIGDKFYPEFSDTTT